MPHSILAHKIPDADELRQLCESNEEFALELLKYIRARERAEADGVQVTLEQPAPLEWLDDFTFNGRRLTLMQRLFVCEYLVDMNAAAAIKRAGSGDTTGKHRESAYAMLRLPHVQAAIRHAMQKRMERLGLRQEEVVLEMRLLAHSDIGDVVDIAADGGIHLKPLGEIPERARRAIKKITTTRGPNGVTTQVELYDKKAALDSLMRHMGMFRDKLEITDSLGIVERLQKARQRVIEARKGEDYEEVDGKRAESDES